MSQDILANHVHTIGSHTSDINWVSFSETTLASCSGDKTVRLWDTKTFSELPCSPLCGHIYSVYCSQFSPFGTMLATCSMDGRLIVWDVRLGEIKLQVQHPSKTSIRVCKFSPDSRTIASGSDDFTVCLWKISSGELIKSMSGHDGSVVCLSFTPDGCYLVSGSSNSDLRVWDGKYLHGKCITMHLEAHDLGVLGCDISSQYTYVNQASCVYQLARYSLATCGQDDLVKIWELDIVLGSASVKLCVRHELVGHKSPVNCVCFSPNGNLLASGSADKTVRLWDAIRGEPLHTVTGHSRYVTSCVFSLDSSLLATGSNDKTVMVWHVTTIGNLTDSGIGSAETPIRAQPPTRKLSIEKWSVDDVCQWVNEIGLGQYEDRFRHHHIDGTELLTLTQDTLETSIKIEALGHRNKILRGVAQLQYHPVIQSRESDPPGIPDEYLCPVTREVMKDPVIAADGYTYEKAAIHAWITKSTRSPMTNAKLATLTLTPNRSLKILIQKYMQEH